MLEGKRVAVVVPAHDEEELVVATLQGIPGFVDRAGSTTFALSTCVANASCCCSVSCCAIRLPRRVSALSSCETTTSCCSGSRFFDAFSAAVAAVSSLLTASICVLTLFRVVLNVRILMPT